MKVRYRTKYGNIKIRIDGHLFDSRKEGRRYRELVLLEAAGEISDLQIHPQYILQEAFVSIQGERIRRITWKLDFGYFDNAKKMKVVEDVKSAYTRKETAYGIRKKLFIYRYPEIEFREV